MSHQSIFSRLAGLGDNAMAFLSRRLGTRAYYFLAALFSLFVLADFAYFHKIGLMERRIFDLLVSHRLHQVAPDPEIVIVDIDEASLNALAKDYGRWPWPRQVIAEWVEGVERQQPKAIVFDILFSDADVFNPNSEAYFNNTIAATDNTFFPMLRLGRQNDALSQIRPSMLPWLAPLPGVTQRDDTLAVVLPRFQAAIDSGRIGTHQVEPDKDSVIRRYPVYLEHAGWMIPSLPQRLADKLGFAHSSRQPSNDDFLINWRGKAFSYKYVSFGDVYLDFLKKNRQRSADEFTGKIVILGSTAPSLFDIKATPTGKIFPGVEILATALDNYKHGDALRELHPGITLVISLVFIWGMAVALVRKTSVDLFDQVFACVQFLFAGVSWLVLNVSLYYVDMSAPITFGLLYFTVARLYNTLGRHWLEGQPLDRGLPSTDDKYLLLVLAISQDTRRESGKDGQCALADGIERLIGSSTAGASKVSRLVESPGLLREMFAGTMLIYWLSNAADAIAAASEDADRMRSCLEQEFPDSGLSLVRHEGTLNAGEDWKTAGRSIVLAALGHHGG